MVVIKGLAITAGSRCCLLYTSFSGKNYHMVAYGVDDKGYIDYDQVRDLAKKHRPKMILAGASAYPRVIEMCIRDRQNERAMSFGIK